MLTYERFRVLINMNLKNCKISFCIVNFIFSGLDYASYIFVDPILRFQLPSSKTFDFASKDFETSIMF